MEVKLTKKFQAQLKNLKKNGKRKQYEQSTMLLYELKSNETPSKNFRPDTRIPNSLKYELPEGYRIVFQKVLAERAVIIALFVGSHADTDEYLNNHRGWIYDPKTLKMREMEVYNPEVIEDSIPYSPKIKDKIQDDNETNNIFIDLDSDLLRNYGFKETEINKIYDISDIDSIEFMELLDELSIEKSDIILAYSAGNNDQKISIVELLQGNSQIITDITDQQLETIDADSEYFVDLSEIDELKVAFNEYDFDNWMIYLHPNQKKYASKEYNGPVRLRGVAGSGKTVVAIHRARNSAQQILNPRTLDNITLIKKNQRVLFITFNKSLCDYIKVQLGRLCTKDEEAIIDVHYFDRLSKELLEESHFPFLSWDSNIENDLWLSIIENNLEKINSMSCFSKIDFRTHRRTSINFLREEINFIFGKFLYSERTNYINCNRRGRIIRLIENDRKIILDIFEQYYSLLIDKMQYIPAIQHQELLSYLEKNKFNEKRYKSIIVDEVQDLNEIQLRIVNLLSNGKNLFLVGDNAQQIYDRGFSFSNVGINIIGRSFCLTRNYRNSKDIMDVARLLKTKQEIGKYDEEPEIAQLTAKTMSINTEKPILIISKDSEEEANTIAREIKYLVEILNIKPCEIVVLSRLSWLRTLVKKRLNENSIDCIEYRADGIRDNSSVKISNLHNIKGHEFRVVFIMGLFEGSIPFVNDQMLEEPEYIEKEASLLYVAMTRAKELLYLTFSKKNQRGIELKKSRFLNDISNTLEIINI